MILIETNTAWVMTFLKFTKRLWVQNEYIPNKQRIILSLETNNALRVVTRTYFFSDRHVHGVVDDETVRVAGRWLAKDILSLIS